MQAKQICILTTAESKAKIRPVKSILFPTPVASAAICHEAMVPLCVWGDFVYSFCFVVQYLVSVLLLQSSHWGR